MTTPRSWFAAAGLRGFASRVGRIGAIGGCAAVSMLASWGCASTDSSTARAPSLASARWHELESGVEASLRGVCAVGDGVVWASGSGGTVLRSLDGGATWRRRPLPSTDIDARDIEARDAMNAWVIGITEPAQVWRTRDGGASWTLLHESDDSASFFDSIALFDGGGGVVFGDPRDGVFEILRSDDGASWVPVDGASIPAAAEGEAAFAASGTCVVTVGAAGHAWIGTGGRRARVLRTEDAGRTWRAAETPMRQGEATTGIYSVAFRDTRRGVVVGGDYTRPELGGGNAAWTDDGGVTWTAASMPPSGYRSCVIWLPGGSEGGSERGSDTLIAVGRGGADWSADGGRTWRPLADPPEGPADGGYHAVSAAPDGPIIAVGPDGRIARLE